MSTFPAVKGQLGTTEYFTAILKADVLVNSVKVASKAFPNWADQTIEERLQREINRKRVVEEIAPYFQDDEDRFFNALVVDVFEGWEKIRFEPLTKFTQPGSIPAAYESHQDDVGFLTLPGGQVLVALDGQHRLEAIRVALEGHVDPRTGVEILEPRPDLANEDLTVIFVRHDEVKKIRKLFGKLNRYAKSTSTSENLRMAEDDAAAIIARMLMNPSKGGLFEQKGVIDYRHSTLSKNSPDFTTLAALYDIASLYLRFFKGYNIPEQSLPPSDDLNKYFHEVKTFLELLLKEVDQIREAFNEKNFKEWRETKRSLIFKPAGLAAMVMGILLAAKYGRLELTEVLRRSNEVDWNLDNEAWKDTIIKPDGNIDARSESKRLVANLVAYSIASEEISETLRSMANKQDGGKKEKPTIMPYQELKETVAHRKGLDNTDGFNIAEFDLPLPINARKDKTSAA